jgi:hypothetical protein
MRVPFGWCVQAYWSFGLLPSAARSVVRSLFLGNSQENGLKERMFAFVDGVMMGRKGRVPGAAPRVRATAARNPEPR